MTLSIGLLGLISLLFAWNLGAHYTGAVMGMSYGSGSIRLWRALILIAVFTFLGATFASHRVEVTVGEHIVSAASVTVREAIVMVLVATVLTFLFNAYKIPSSTIQIFVFSILGTGVAAGIPVHWGKAVLSLIVVWIFAPVAGLVVGFVMTKVLDRVGRPSTGRLEHPVKSLSWLARCLVLMGVVASFTMGANDVANASGVLVMTHSASTWTAGIIAGAAMAVGVLTWGKGLLQKVGFDIVKVDLSMATAAQLGQAFVVLVAVSQGIFTSMNQSLVGAMTGAGLARGQDRIDWKAIRGILKGWVIAPVSGFLGAFALYHVVALF